MLMKERITFGRIRELYGIFTIKGSSGPQLDTFEKYLYELPIYRGEDVGSGVYTTTYTSTSIGDIIPDTNRPIWYINGKAYQYYETQH